MSRYQKKKMLYYAVALAMIALAFLCKILAKNYVYSFSDKLFNLVRIFIYFALLFAWAVSVRRRVMQRQVKSILTAIILLMGYWLLLREFKFRYVIHTDIMRYLWYSYYIPLLLLPLLSLFVSMSLSQSESYRLPSKTFLLFIPAAFLIAMVLTNDFHQLVFRFPEHGAFSEHSASYAFLSFVIVGWQFALLLGAFALMLVKNRLPGRKRKFLSPVLAFSAAAVYLALYGFRVHVVMRFFGDFVVVFCLVYAAFFESCIQCGLIQSNERYFDLFQASKDLRIGITESHFAPRYRTEAFIGVSEKQLRASLTQSVVIENSLSLHGMSIDGGYAFWQEDTADLLSIRQTLKERGEELRERNALLSLEYEREKQHKITEQQNKLYDLLQSKTQTQLDRIDSLVNAYESAHGKSEKKRILAQISVLGSFIKRRKNLTLSAYEKQKLPANMLESAFAESFYALRMLGIHGGYRIESTICELPGETMCLMYDFFECVCEQAFTHVKYLNVVVGTTQNGVRISIVCEQALPGEIVRSQFPRALYFEEEDEARWLLEFGGGGEK